MSSCTPGCPEYGRVSRRGFLTLAAGALAATTVFGDTVLQTAWSREGAAPAVLVVLSLRGAADGLNLVVPHADPAYWTARPRIAIPKDRLLAADAMFGLHPALAPLLPLWRDGRMAAVHATGLPAPNRSHFSAMEEIEDADPGSPARVGWLNRLVGRDGDTDPLHALHLGGPVPPTALLGPHPVGAAPAVDDIVLAGTDTGGPDDPRVRSLHTVWDGVPGPLGEGVRTAMRMVDDFGPVRATPVTPANGAAYPTSDLGRALAAAARTIRGDVGAEVITVDHGSWDMHADLGTVDRGDLRNMTADLASSLAAFFSDLGPVAEKVTVVTLSEFGRRVRENASMGLDHGHGNVMFLLGAGVKGGRYYGSWPGLTDTAQADLLVTRDYRSVLAEVVSSRFDASPAAVFPGVRLETIGAMAPR